MEDQISMTNGKACWLVAVASSRRWSGAPNAWRLEAAVTQY